MVYYQLRSKAYISNNQPLFPMRSSTWYHVQGVVIQAGASSENRAGERVGRSERGSAHEDSLSFGKQKAFRSSLHAHAYCTCHDGQLR